MKSSFVLPELTDPVYLDYNATTPVDPRVANEMQPFLCTDFGNPSSGHSYGIQTKRAINKARQQVADLLNCSPASLLFTSGGTEANNHAIRGYAFAHQKKGNHLVTTSIEHPAVLNVCHYLEKFGFEITIVPVDQFGMVDPKSIEKAIRPETILISVMLANNEVGTIQPVREICEIAHKNGIAVHCDAAQAVGKIPVDVNELGIDLLSVAGHKFYAPKGIGALYIKPGTELEVFMLGGGQENGQRAGTENILEIVGLGAAAAIAKENLLSEMQHSRHLRDLLWQGIQQKFPTARLNGHPEKRLPNTLNVSFPAVDEFSILNIFSEIAASAGAACHAKDISISPVLQAMQVPLEYARNTIRFSVGRFTTEAHIEKALKILDNLRI